MRSPSLGALILAVGISAMPAATFAASAQSSFGLRLVIEPACDPAQDVAVAGDALDAQRLALAFRASENARIAGIDHHRADTGKWLVTFTDGQTLLVTKCTGAVEAGPSQTA